MNNIKIFTDGGSRGNPGPAACAFIVFNGDIKVASGSKYLGIATNNNAEYNAVILSLDWLEENQSLQKIESVDYILDSQLVVRQLNKVYRVKDVHIKELYDRVISKISRIPCSFNFYSVTRDKNKDADKLVNETLDKAQNVSVK